MRLKSGCYYLINKHLFYIKGTYKSLVSAIKLWKGGEKFSKCNLEKAVRVPKFMIKKLFFID